VHLVDHYDITDDTCVVVSYVLLSRLVSLCEDDVSMRLLR
jgi:hypothetical protein